MKFSLQKTGYVSLLILSIAISPKLLAQAPAPSDEVKEVKPAATVQNEEPLIDISSRFFRSYPV